MNWSIGHKTGQYFRVVGAAILLTACSVAPEANNLTFAEICADSPQTHAMIRDLLIMEPGMTDLACKVAAEHPELANKASR